jgi:anaerobic magnesium-protoporphyrin IX monomethyl ester cyclase
MTSFLGLPARRPLVILLYPKVDHEKDYVCFWMPFSLLTVAKPLLDDGLADGVLFDSNQTSDEARATPR